MKYIDWFIKKSQRAKDLLDLDLFPNGKEIEESFAMLNCCLSKLKTNSQDESVLCVVVGDGGRPRTACTIAFHTKWSSISIDPALKNMKQELKDKLDKVERFEYHDRKIEEIVIDGFFDDTSLFKKIIFNKVFFKTIIFIHPHSHAFLSETIKFKNQFGLDKEVKVWLISMPCCVSDNLNKEYYSYMDNHIHSPKNRINIYAIDNCNLKELNI